jgi:hypothetical protein
MNFLSQNPLKREEEGNVRPNYTQVGQTVQQGPTLTDKAMDIVAPKIMESAMTAGANALATPTATATLGQALGGTAVTGGMGAAMGAMAGPVGMAAMLALPYLLNNGTTSVPGYMNGTQGVPEMDYGPDPLQGYMNGTTGVQGYNNGIPGVPGLAGMAMDKFGIKSPMSVVGKALGFNDGTNSVPGYMNGTSSITPTTAMHLAGGEDSVLAMLTPEEAVIPAPAAQNPKNKPAINAMIAEGSQANSVANSTAFLNNGTQKVSEAMPQEPMMGPLSGKSQREEMKVLQDMSLKKKAWEAEEARKQKAFEQKYAHNDMKAMLSMRQS